MKIHTKIANMVHTYQEPVKAYLLSMRDVRNVGTLAFVVLVLLISWSGVRAIETNYRLQQEVARMQEQNEVKKLQNENQKLENQYYTTPQYKEVTARQNLGLASPGETVLLVPKDVALAHTVIMPNERAKTSPAKKKPFYQKNFEAWIDFFFHRTPSLSRP
ncbi:septum formation initiator family protein [Candidatus Saccharibacteria bacterium]|nr:MAG: septum formation initiator family protein [Candidatus Saccharibacteria bacterium]